MRSGFSCKDADFEGETAEQLGSEWRQGSRFPRVRFLHLVLPPERWDFPWAGQKLGITCTRKLQHLQCEVVHKRTWLTLVDHISAGDRRFVAALL